MTLYRVSFVSRQPVYGSITVKANSEEEAMEIANWQDVEDHNGWDDAGMWDDDYVETLGAEEDEDEDDDDDEENESEC